jgi:penicillin-binding protein 1A
MAQRRTATSRRASFAKRHPRLVRSVLLVTAFTAAALLGGGYAAWALVCRGGACPAVALLDDYTPRQTSKLYASDGRFISEIGLERRTLVAIAEIPAVVRGAFVITEDRRFYSHRGVDFIGLGGAVKDRLLGDRLRGASTITQQLARNVFPERISRERSLVRKLREAKVARQIEERYSKEKILELYLNQISLGNGAFGVETASQRYFGKSVRNLNIAEAATLAALPKAPERYNPRRYPERAVQRRNTVIELMRRNGVISDADASLAKAYPLRLAPREEAGDVAPYFVEWVRQQLDAHFGRRLYEQGLKVYTTIDLDMQSAAERALEGQLKAIEGGKYGAYPHPTYEQVVAGRAGGEASAGPNTRYLQGAFVAMEPRTGAVRALVGGRDFDESKFNRATQALRQPGSTFKPVVYADAVRNGRPPSFIVEDAPISLPQEDGSTWSPQNYDGQFQGAMPMRRALYQSRNLATIRLGQSLGERDVIAMARRFGISTPIPAYPSIHIGAADVYPIEMIAAYTAFASLGTRAAPYAIVRVENASGEVLWQPAPVRTATLSAEEAWIMVDMMRDVVRRGTAAGSVGALFSAPAGGKTGTTNDGADVWYIGYTSELVAGVWMGMDRPRKIKANAQGGVLAAPAWTTFMREIYRRRSPPADWPRPAGIVVRTVDRTNGLLENPYCPREAVSTEYYVSGTEPLESCQEHNEFNSYLADSLGSSAPAGPPGQPTLPRDTANPFRLPP